MTGWLICAGVVVILATAIYWISRLETKMGNDPATSSVDALMARLYEDESWQGNLTDEERKVALSWAAEHLRTVTQGALTEARQRLRTLNSLMGPSPNFVARDAVLRAWLE